MKTTNMSTRFEHSYIYFFSSAGTSERVVRFSDWSLGVQVSEPPFYKPSQNLWFTLEN